MKSRRNYASFWQWGEKNIKEREIMRDFLKARDILGLPGYAEVEVCKPPVGVHPTPSPDFIARSKTDYVTAVELTELVCQKAIQANILASRREERVYRDWTQGEVCAAIEERLARKDSKKYPKESYDEVHVVIHVDEPLISPSEYVPFLSKILFAPCQQITRAFILFSYDPMSDGYPCVELQLSK
jgi:hypothetical protein